MVKKEKSPPKMVLAVKAKATLAKKNRGKRTSEDRILDALASQLTFGIEAADRNTVQSLAAMTNKRSFDTILLNMKKKGLVTYDSKTASLTDAGVDQIGPEATSVPQSNDAMQAKLRELIKQKKSREIFDIMLDGRFYSRSELAEKMCTEDNKSFGTYVSALSKIVDRENGKIGLKGMAFPCGRPSDDNA